MNHGVDCPCPGCEKVRIILRYLDKKGKIELPGTEEEKKKIREGN